MPQNLHPPSSPGIPIPAQPRRTYTFASSSRAPLLPVVTAKGDERTAEVVLDTGQFDGSGSGKGGDGRAGEKGKRVFCFTGGKKASRVVSGPASHLSFSTPRPPLSPRSASLASSASSASSTSTLTSSTLTSNPSTSSTFSSPSSSSSASYSSCGSASGRLLPSTSTSGLDLKVSLEKDLFLALENQIAKEGDLFSPLEHSDTRETLVRIDFPPSSSSLVEGDGRCDWGWRLSEEVKGVLREAAELTRRRMLVLLSSPALLPPHLRPSLSHSSKSISFRSLERLLRQIYGTVEEVKKRTGRRGVLVDVGIEGWSRGGEGEVASMLQGGSRQGQEGLRGGRGGVRGFNVGTGWLRTFGPLVNSAPPYPCPSPSSPFSTSASASEGEEETATEGEESVETMAIGGGFDQLGASGKVRLTLAAWSAKERLVVGVCSDVPTRTKESESPPLPLEMRTQLVHRFLSFVAPGLRLSLPCIDREDDRRRAIRDGEVDGVVIYPSPAPSSRGEQEGLGSGVGGKLDAIDAGRVGRGYRPLRRFEMEGDREGTMELPRSEEVRRWIKEKEGESR